MHVPLTVLMVHNPVVVRAISARKGLTRGNAYRVLVVNYKGAITVAPENALATPVQGWFPMDAFEIDSKLTALEAANDNQ